MTVILTDEGELGRAVARQIGRPAGLITFDGFDGTGKSHLAGALATRLGLACLGLDSFLEQNRGCFVEAIRLADLTRAIAASGTSAIVEGVCVLQVLNRLGMAPILKIYVRRVSSSGAWGAAEYLDCPDGPEPFIAKEKQRNNEFGRWHGDDTPLEAEPETLRHEIIRYHYAARPHLTADYVFDRVA